MYFGSGKVIKLAIAKYGEHDFVRETLFSFETKSEAMSKERELVNAEVLKDPNCYNLVIGGSGGFRVSKEQARELGRQNIKGVHIQNAQSGHWKRLGKMNAERIRGSSNRAHSEWMKARHKAAPMLWWTDGKTNKRSDQSPGPEWYRGQVRHAKS